MSEQVRVLVVDDDALVRAGLTMLLAGAEEIAIVGETYEVKPLAVGIAAGIVLDATIIRVLLVPALMRLLGSANLWVPRRRLTAQVATSA